MRHPFGVLFSLSWRQLRARMPARFAWLGAWTVALVFFVIIAAVVERLRVGSLLGDALAWMCWLGAGPVALSAATDPAARARQEGIAALAHLHGIGRGALVASRILAAMAACVLRIALPGAALCLALALSAGSGALALAALSALGMAMVVGGALGAIGAVCGELAGERGALCFAAIVVLPWLIADAWTLPDVSLPGLVELSTQHLLGALACPRWP